MHGSKKCNQHLNIFLACLTHADELKRSINN